MIRKISKFKRKHKIVFAIIIGLSVVSFWRGAWGIMDVYIFPNNYGISSLVCFLIGIGLLSVTNYVVEELM